jgi:uncharacterized protein (DUF2141 family)
MMTAMSGTNLAVTAAEKDGRPGMRSLLSPLALALAFGAATAASAQSPGKLNVSVAGVRNDNGSVRCGLYSSANGFREPGREMRGAVAPIKNGQATCVFNSVPAGTYAIAVFHAERNETQMETGLFGKPKQGYGFSNNPPGVVRTADLSEFFAAFV